MKVETRRVLRRDQPEIRDIDWCEVLSFSPATRLWFVHVKEDKVSVYSCTAPALGIVFCAPLVLLFQMRVFAATFVIISKQKPSKMTSGYWTVNNHFGAKRELRNCSFMAKHCFKIWVLKMQVFRRRLSHNSTKTHAAMLIGNMGSDRSALLRWGSRCLARRKN